MISLAGAAFALVAGSPASGYGKVVAWGPGPSTAVAISGSCAIVESGAVVCWPGGPGWEVDPPPPEVDGSLGTATALSGTCAIQAGTDAVVCWGNAPAPPPEVDGTLGGASAIDGSCAIRADTGGVVCWGADDHGQATPPPTVDGTLGAATAIETGGFHACAIQAGSGATICWGRHRAQYAAFCGYGGCTYDYVTQTPTPPPGVDGTLGTATALAGSGSVTCAIQTGSNAVVCWGFTVESYCGNDGCPPPTGPPPPPPPELDGTEGSATAIAPSRFGGFCAIQAETGNVICWATSLQPPASVDGTLGAAIAIDSHCAIQAGTNELVCWRPGGPPGSVNGTSGTAIGIAADDAGGCAIRAGPLRRPGDRVECWETGAAWRAATTLAGGPLGFCGINDGGAVACWDAPPWVDGTEGTATAIAHSDWHDCAIQEGTGAVICWGGTGVGQARPPASVNGREGSAAAIAIGTLHSCAIQAGSGAVVCWGFDGDGQATPPPSVDGTLGTATAIAARHATSCAIQAGSGAVVCWGFDGDGQATPPASVDGTLGSATAITVGLSRSCAIQAGTGAPVCWGTPDWPLPPSIAGSASIATAIAVAGDRTFALMVPTSCPDTPDPTCTIAGKALLKIDERDPDKTKLKATLRSLGTTMGPGEFGDPIAGTTAYELCLYNREGLLRGALQVDRAGDFCGRSPKPCWKSTSKGLKYADPEGTADGVRKLSAKGGAAGRGRLSVLAANKRAKEERDMPLGIAPALEREGGAHVQMRTSDAACFGAELTSVRKANGLLFKAKTP